MESRLELNIMTSDKNNGCSFDDPKISLKTGCDSYYPMRKPVESRPFGCFRHSKVSKRCHFTGNNIFRGNLNKLSNHSKPSLHPTYLLSSTASFCLLISILLILVLSPPVSTSGELYATAANQQMHNKYSSQCK